MPAGAVTVADLDDLIALPSRYLAAVEDGAEELVIELPRAALGLDRPGALGGLELASISARTVPAIDVVLRAPEPPCVLVGLPLHIAARSVTVEGVAMVAGPAPSLSVTATASIALRDVAVLGALGSSEGDPAAVLLRAAETSGVSLTVAQSVIARSAADGALLALRCDSGAWWDEIAAEDACLAAHGPVGALIAIDAVRRLALRDCTLATGGMARAAIASVWPPLEAELAGCRVDVSDPFALLSVQQKTPIAPAPGRLTGGTGLTFAAAQLPLGLTADESVVEVSADAVGAAARATTERTVERVVAVDPRLADRVGA